MKRIIVCLDGTWNNISRPRIRDDSRVYRPTNVLKTARAIQSVDSHATPQVCFYSDGVGSTNRSPSLRDRILNGTTRLLGGGWGTGFEANIEAAYSFLSLNYCEEDEIFIFGFSRGAAQARSLVRFIEWAGGIPKKTDAYYSVELLDGYLKNRASGSGDTVVKTINERRRLRGSKDYIELTNARIKFLGLWDTVLALGARVLSVSQNSTQRYQFHISDSPPMTPESICHALAIDEHRHDFRAEIWNKNSSAKMEQRWFAGGHADIGGGLDDDRLANNALKWVCSEASKLGLEFDDGFLSNFQASSTGATCTTPFLYRVTDTLRYLFGQYYGSRKIEGCNIRLDQSVYERLRKDQAYRPKNLLQFLRNSPQHEALLAEVTCAQKTDSFKVR